MVSTGYLYEFLPLTAQQASRTGHPLQSAVTWGTKMPSLIPFIA